MSILNDPTDWEIGNDLMHKICDELTGLANESGERKYKQVHLKEVFFTVSMILGTVANDLQDESRMCPESENLLKDIRKLEYLLYA